MAVSPEHEQTPHASTPTPIWMTDPGVPLIARVLAITLGATLVLAIWMTFTLERPPDDPPLPDGWSELRLDNGLAVQYPHGWASTINYLGEQSLVNIALLPDSPVHIDILVYHAGRGGTVSPTFIEARRQGMRSIFHGYTELGAGEGYPHDVVTATRFSFLDAEKRSQPVMKGAWVIKHVGSYAVVLIATSPQRGWYTMENSIFIPVISGIVEAPAPGGNAS